jgi:hypothetical protein
MIHLIINAVLINIAWLVTVVPAAQGMTWAGPAFSLLWLAVHSTYYTRTRLADISLCILAAIIGYLADSLLVITGVMSFPELTQQGSPSTVWMVALWINLALTLNHSLRWLHNRLLFAAILGTGAAALAYYTGNKLGAINLDLGVMSLLYIGLMWFAAMPLLVWLTQQVNLLEKKYFPANSHNYEHC